MNVLKRVWAYFQLTELRLWHMIVAAIATVVIQALVANNDRREEQRIERSKELVDVASDFENSVNRLVNSANSFEALDQKLALALESNVEAQIRAVNKIRPSLSGGDQTDLANKYLLTLVEIREILADGLQAPETRRFGLAAQNLTVLRDDLLKSLDDNSLLPFV